MLQGARSFPHYRTAVRHTSPNRAHVHTICYAAASPH